MTASTLSLTSGAICDLIQPVTGVTTAGDALGYLQAAYRRFLSGQYNVPGDAAPHVWTWSFLRPLAELTVGGAVTATTASGVVSSDGTYSTVTVTNPATGIFNASMIGQVITIADTPARSATITGFSSPTVAFTTDVIGFSSLSVTVATTGIVALPSDFGSILDGFQYPRSDSRTYPSINSQSPYDIITAWRHQTSAEWPYPYAFAIMPKPFVTATGQQYEAWFAPVPTTAVTMLYRYAVNPAPLADDANFPLGGWQHSDTLLYMALADWELKSGRGVGVWAQRAQDALMASIEIDREMTESSAPPHMGMTGPRTRVWY